MKRLLAVLACLLVSLGAQAQTVTSVPGLSWTSPPTGSNLLNFSYNCAGGTTPCFPLVTIYDGTTRATVNVNGGLNTNLLNASIPVTGTFWQTTQPVSIATMPTTPVTGVFWQTTQPVSGTFFQATQPVSLASGSVAASAYSLGSFVSGALVDGAIATMGTQADTVWSGSGSGSEIAILKKIATGGSGGGPVTLAAGSVAAGAYVAGSYVDGAITTMGLKADTAWDGVAASPTEMAVLKKIATNSSTLTWPGTAGVAAGGTASAGTMPYVNAYLNGTLPAFASTPTVIANAGTNLNTSALALEAGGNLAGIKANQTNGTELVRATVDGVNTIFGATTPGRIACPDGTTTCFTGSGGNQVFTPDYSYSTPLPVTTTSATTPLPTGGTPGKTVIVYNVGPNSIYWIIGNSSVAATISDSFLAPQSWAAATIAAGQTTIAAITKVTGQTATLNAESGTGMPQGTGGPLNASVMASGSTAVFLGVVGGVDNTTAANFLGVTAAGTATTKGAAAVQGAGPTSVPFPVVAAPNITAQSCFAGPLVANVPQNLINISTSTNGFMLQNIDATSGGGEALWVSFVGAAAVGAVDSFALPPPSSATTMANAGSFTTPIWFGTKGPVSVVAATSGHKLSCVLGHT